MKKIAAALFCLTVIQNSYAGFNGLTVHSRANCGGINETISWDLLQPKLFQTQGEHIKANNYNDKHSMRSEEELTRRSAVIHWTESYKPGVYIVAGVHKITFQDGNFIYAHTSASDCNLYDGWWD